jgi:hypothetical protein
MLQVLMRVGLVVVTVLGLGQLIDRKVSYVALSLDPPT